MGRLLRSVSRLGAIVSALALVLLVTVPGRAAPITYLHHFSGPDGFFPDAALTTDGVRLYGTTNGSPQSPNTGTIFAMDLDGQNFETLHVFPLDFSEGVSPEARLLIHQGTLYGTTVTGGEHLAGTIFAIQPDGTDFRVLHHFDNVTGANPFEGLTPIGSRFYGTTNFGGSVGVGTVFSINVDGSDYQMLHEFTDGDDGRRPNAAPILVGDRLVGTAAGAGPHDQGVIFSMELDGSDFQVLHAFEPGEGITPAAGVVLIGDQLYGATDSGAGVSSHGTIYSISIDGTDFKILHQFHGVDGHTPSRDLVTDGNDLFGTTFGGGEPNDGVVFSIALDGSQFQVLHSFSATPDGDLPDALLSVNGVLYGTTRYGGIHDAGTVYAIVVPEPPSIGLAFVALTALAIRRC
jgi:uncharacterized repeat protein (TIGR03803 family)